MKNINKYTKKNLNQKYKHPKKQSRTYKNFKKGGSGSEYPSSINSGTNLEKESIEKLEQIKKERHEKELENAEKNNKFVNDAVIVAEGIGANAIEGIGNVIGVDIANPEKTTAKLNEIKETLTDPQNLKKVEEIVGEVAEKGAVIYKAAEPLIDPIANKLLDEGEKVAKKMADTGTTILSNAIKEIPGVGLVYSLVQDASKVGEATAAVISAASEITTDAADSAVVFNENLKKLQEENVQKYKMTAGRSKKLLKGLKKDRTTVSNRITRSVNKFENPLNNKSVSKKKRRVHFQL